MTRRDAREAYYYAHGRQEGLWEAYKAVKGTTDYNLPTLLLDLYIEASEATNTAWAAYSQELDEWLATL